MKQGQHDGDVPRAAPVDVLAAYYSTVLYGIALQSKDGTSRKTLTQVVEFAMANWQQFVGGAANGQSSSVLALAKLTQK